MSDEIENAASIPEPETTELETPEPETPTPPPTFEFFVLSLKFQAEMAMGLLNFGDPKDRPEPDLRVARHAIDLMAMLQEKTRGNLTLEEQRLIENSVTELRFRFVQAAQTSGQTATNA